ncbi:kinesin-like protein KIF6 isoform X3 [Alligator mississippiensis]|uniref:Kinesin-like protein n=1 Tax=Alligator mississippiensis TaxID=8496 RepID=A0A151P3W8_ALLMI|nr:kinesin-like protein KIF6 isoform X3 [Alligator mississippiensis]KYO43445.1 kinesin-like protein KIF6 isoform B [Alligator mississippiensis]
MGKQTIPIYARVKPLARRQRAGIYSIEEDRSASSLQIIVPRDLADGFVNNKRESYKFKFQKIFDQETKQDDIFENIAKPVAECALSGYNGTVFAYGQTGSGKTFTITGGAERYNDRGIIPRTLSYIFQQLQKDSSKVYTTHVSYLEIYNECGYDLLDPRHEASRLEDLPKVTIMEDPDQNIHLKNLSLQQATNEEEALNLLFLGDTNRMIAETPMNQASTRSHCIFTIHISSKEPGSATVRRSKLHLVDLAGSERVAKTGVGGQLLTEAKYINLSLHYLEQVIIALAEKHRSHIPYRNSMMTSVLRDSLGGNCMTTMIATLSLDKRNIDESISTCRFAQRVALIKNEAVLNEEIDPRLMIVQLKKEIQELKDELAMVTGEQRTEELTQEELLQLDELIKRFLEDTDRESTLDVGPDMRKIKYCFNHVKQLMSHAKIPDKNLLAPDITGDKTISVGKEELKKLREILQQRDSEINILVHMLKKEKKKAQDSLFQLSIGSSDHTTLESSPSVSLEGGERTSTCDNVKEAKHFSPSVHRASFLLRRTDGSGEMSLGRQEAFEIFKRDYADNVTIEDNKQLLKQRFAEAKSLGEKVNEVRNKINHLKEEITQRHMQRAALGVASPSEELNKSDPVEEKLRAQLEDEKKSYKTMFNRLKGLKIEIEHLQLLMEKAKVKLQKDFEIWWSEEARSLQEQLGKPHLSNSPSALTTSPRCFESQHQLYNNRFSESRRANPNEYPTGENSMSNLSDSASQIRLGDQVKFILTFNISALEIVKRPPFCPIFVYLRTAQIECLGSAT